MNPTERMLQWFEFDYLPTGLQWVVLPIRALAHEMARDLEPSAELTTGLRKLLEAKDCFVRAKIEGNRK